MMLKFILIFFVISMSNVDAQNEPKVDAQLIDLELMMSKIKDPFISKAPPPKPKETGISQDQIQQQIQQAQDMAQQVVEVVRPQKPELMVEGIVWGDKIQQAIINGIVVNVGDRINEAQVKSVSKDGVVVVYQGFDYLLSVP